VFELISSGVVEAASLGAGCDEDASDEVFDAVGSSAAELVSVEDATVSSYGEAVVSDTVSSIVGSVEVASSRAAAELINRTLARRMTRTKIFRIVNRLMFDFIRVCAASIILLIFRRY
jgi:hypothetical protein